MNLEYELVQDDITIGRASENNIVLPDKMVSGSHARLTLTAVGYAIVDLGSSNGTLLNDERLVPDEPILLESGAIIEIAPYWLIYERFSELSARIRVTSGETFVSSSLPPEQLPTSESDDTPAVSEHDHPPPAAGRDFDLPINGNGRRSANGSDDPDPSDCDELLRELSPDHSSYIQYLPDLYDTKAMHYFLAAFEAIWTPIEWHIDHFDLALNPYTAPAQFLPWLAAWFTITFDESWNEQQQRKLLAHAPWIYQRRGTKGALARVLEIYTGKTPLIDDDPVSEENPNSLPAHTFHVMIPLAEQKTNRKIIEQLISIHKPAHTNYQLSFI